jgi:CHAT domain-containing protein
VSEVVLGRSRFETTASDSSREALRDSLQYARSRLSHLFIAGPGDDNIAAYKTRMAAAESEKLRLEREWARVTDHNFSEPATGTVEVDSLLRLIPSGAAFVEYVRYSSRDFSTDREFPAYLGVVMRAGQAPLVYNLGRAGPVDSVVWLLRDEMDSMTRLPRGPRAEDVIAYRALAGEIAKRIWAPLSSSLTDSITIMISPDGPLNLLSFAALPLGEDGYLIEAHPIHYVSGIGDLLARRRPASPTSGLLAVGNPQYDGQPADLLALSADSGRVAISSAERFRSLPPGCDALRQRRFSALPGTQLEIEDVAREWARRWDSRVDLVTGANASEKAVKASARGYRAIHFATHAFFLSDSCDDGGSEGHANPLLLSGLCFSGANEIGRGSKGGSVEDGILTAEEVCNLDLSGTDWVVLSACFSGAGEIRSGEGIYGLRRAFLLAGAKTVISSLWEVSDQAMPRMIKALYAHADSPLPTALQESCLAELNELRARGLPDHPFSWAGLVAVGDWHGLQVSRSTSPTPR